MLKFLLSLFLILSFSYGNNVGIPDNTCALIVASRATKTDVKAYVDENISYTKYVTLYEANNGWYAIALGFLKDSEAKSVMRQWKSSGKIPSDSFCTHGNKFKKEIFIDDDTYITPSSSSYKINSRNYEDLDANYDKKQLKCLALTWGPDVCSQAFSEYVKKKDDIDDVNDIIKSPVCTTMIAKTLEEDVTEADLEIAMLTGALDEGGTKGMESDNFFYKALGGIAYMYSFGIKLTVYESCMNK